jgi:hypothetical protein
MMADRRTRREFMGLTVAGGVGALTPSWLKASPYAPLSLAVDPDVVVLNAKVYTMDATTPRAEAFAISNGRLWPSGRLPQ